MSQRSVPFRRLRKELIKKSLLSAGDVAALVDGATWNNVCIAIPQSEA